MTGNFKLWRLVGFSAIGLCVAGYVVVRVLSVGSECPQVTEIVLNETKPFMALPAGTYEIEVSGDGYFVTCDVTLTGNAQQIEPPGPCRGDQLFFHWQGWQLRGLLVPRETKAVKVRLVDRGDGAVLVDGVATTRALPETLTPCRQPQRMGEVDIVLPTQERRGE